jgi:hypothetical protein
MNENRSANYAVYNTATGEITKGGVCQYSDMELQKSHSGESVTEHNASINDEKQYVNTESGTVLPRPEFGLVVTGGVITSIPPNTLVKIFYKDGKFLSEYVIDDGECDLVGSETGDYRLVISCFPYVEEMLELTL